MVGMIPSCACSKPMIRTHTEEIYVCISCDGVQPQELKGERRVLNPQDHAFNSEMRRREAVWYGKGGNKSE